MSTIQPRRAWVLSAGLAASCAIRAATLNPKALGCYTVQSHGWSEQAASVTGFRALARTVVLDSVFVQEGGRRVIVPPEWQVQGVQRNRATWDNTASSWMRINDSIIFIPSASAFHDLAGDSIIVRWAGWGGGLTAFLAPTAYGYRGLAQLNPRQLATGAPTILVELYRTSCSSSGT